MSRHVRVAMVTVIVIAASAAVTAGAATLHVHGSGPGMMGGSHGSGMMGGGFGATGGGGAGSTGTATPTSTQLQGVQSRINHWLAASGFKGFAVAEVMAFTNNDYVAVHDKSGKPAFELLTDLNTN